MPENTEENDYSQHKHCPECGWFTEDIDKQSGLCYACHREAELAEEDNT